MADEHIKIVIGAAKSASVDRVFRDIRRDANKIGSELGRFFNRAAKGLNSYAAGVRQVTDSVRGQLKEEERAARARNRQATEAEKQERRQAAARQYVHNLRMRQLQREATEQERVSRREEAAFQKRMQRFARMTSHRTTRFFWPNAPVTSVARRAGTDIARGIGLDLSPSSHLRSVVEQEQLATRITSKAYTKGAEGEAGVRVDPTVLRQEMRELTRQLGNEGGTQALLEAAQAFVGQRGNLAGFRSIAPELAKRITAYGMEAGEAGLMAAKIDSALANQAEFADDEKRNKAVMDLIDNLIHQGKIGSVEGAELAKQLPKLSGIAGQFTGDATQNMKELVTVMQLAERGPAKNAATASTYVQNLALQISKRAAAFKDVGVDVFDPNDPNRIRHLSDLIPELLEKTSQFRDVKIKGRGTERQNQIQQLQGVMPNIRSFLALQEFFTVLSGKGDMEEGLRAIRGEFERFSEGSVAKQLQEDLDAVGKTTANSVEKLNAELEGVADEFARELLPAVREAGPLLRDFAKVLGETATWVVSNPKKAIAAAIGISVSRALTESFFRTTLEKALMSGGPVMGKTLAETVGKNVRNIAIVGATIGIAQATLHILKSLDKGMEGHDRDFSPEEIGKDFEDAALLFGRDKNFWKNLRTGDVRDKTDPDAGGRDVVSVLLGLMRGKAHQEEGGFTSKDPEIRRAAGQRAERMRTSDPDAVQAIQRVEEAIDRKLSGTLTVRVEGATPGRGSQAGDPP